MSFMEMTGSLILTSRISGESLEAAMLLIASAVTYGFITLYVPGQYLIAVEENVSREDEISGLFEPFTRREPSRSRESGGSGLGLFIVLMVLEPHHFSYRMENTDDGIRFSIVMPE